MPEVLTLASCRKHRKKISQVNRLLRAPPPPPRPDDLISQETKLPTYLIPTYVDWDGTICTSFRIPCTRAPGWRGVGGGGVACLKIYGGHLCYAFVVILVGGVASTEQ